MLHENGQCRVQHLTFNTMLDLLEDFRERNIPMETGGVTPVKLTQYVMPPHITNARRAQGSWPSQGPERRPAPAPDVTEVSFFIFYLFYKVIQRVAVMNRSQC